MSSPDRGELRARGASGLLCLLERCHPRQDRTEQGPFIRDSEPHEIHCRLGPHASHTADHQCFAVCLASHIIPPSAGAGKTRPEHTYAKYGVIWTNFSKISIETLMSRLFCTNQGHLTVHDTQSHPSASRTPSKVLSYMFSLFVRLVVRGHN